MENKLVSLILKVGMAVLFILGLVLIWNNISLAPGSDEDIALTDQSFFVIEHALPNDEDGRPQEPVKEVFYSYVLDESAHLVYDLSEKKVYEYDAFVNSQGKEKIKVAIIEDGMLEGKLIKNAVVVNGNETDGTKVNDLMVKNYEFQNATEKSISYTQWLMYIAFAAIFLFSLINIIKEPKRFIRSAIGFVALILIAFICYKVAPEVGTGKMLETSNYTDESFHYTGTGIYITATLIAISAALILIQAVVGLTRFFSK